MKTIQGTSRHQIQFGSLDDLIVADNPVRIIDAFVEKLDLAKLGIKQPNTGKQQKSKPDPGGAPHFDDKLLLKLYLYGYLNKIRSSRKLEQECCRNVELRWLMEELSPNYHSIADLFPDESLRSSMYVFALIAGGDLSRKKLYKMQPGLFAHWSVCPAY